MNAATATAAKSRQMHSSYADAIRMYRPLKREEEHALAVRAKAGDEAARQKLLRHNLSWCVTVASRYRLGAVPIDDVIQQVTLGLMRALEKYDPDSGNRFITYALFWMKAYATNFLRGVRSSVSVRSGVTAAPDLSLDDPVGDGDDDATFVELIVDDGPGPLEQVVCADSDLRVREALEKVRKRIGPVGWDVVHTRLMRDSHDADSLEVLGQRHGVSRERIRQIETRTLAFLSRYLPEALEPSWTRCAAGQTSAPEPGGEEKHEASLPEPKPEHREESAPLDELEPRAGPRHPLLAETLSDEALVEHVRHCFPGLPKGDEEALVWIARAASAEVAAATRGCAPDTMRTRWKRLYPRIGVEDATAIRSTLLARALARLASGDTVRAMEKEDVMPKGIRSTPCRGCGSVAIRCPCTREKGKPAKEEAPPPQQTQAPAERVQIEDVFNGPIRVVIPEEKANPYDGVTDAELLKAMADGWAELTRRRTEAEKRAAAIAEGLRVVEAGRAA